MKMVTIRESFTGYTIVDDSPLHEIMSGLVDLNMSPDILYEINLLDVEETTKLPETDFFLERVS